MIETIFSVLGLLIVLFAVGAFLSLFVLRLMILVRLKLDDLQFGRMHGFQNQAFQVAHEPIHAQPRFYHESSGEIDVELDLSDN